MTGRGSDARDGLDVVYVNYNSSDLLLDSLRSLLAHTSPDELGEIVVVENGSAPGEAARLSELPGSVELIGSDRNLGYGAACNLGATRGRSKHLLFLNPDTLFLPGTIRELLHVLRAHEGRVLAGPRQFADPELVFTISPLRGVSVFGEVSDVLYARGWWGESSLRYLDRRVEATRSDSPSPVRCLSGSALAAGRATFESLGRWDEDFFLYSEDTDLGVRARAAGVPVLYVPSSTMVHFGEQSTATRPEESERAGRASRTTFLAKHGGPLGSRLSRAATRAAALLPALRRREDHARPVAPDHEFRFPEPSPDRGLRVFELGRSPLFDNCLTALTTGDSFRIPGSFLDRLPAGRFFARLAEKPRGGRWRERGLFRIEKEERRNPLSESAEEVSARS